MTNIENKDMNEQKPLTKAELQRLTYLYIKMSKPAKDSFIVMVMTKFPDNFSEIIDFLGDNYERSKNRA